MKLENKNGNIEIIKDADGKSLVIVNDIRFKGRQGIKGSNAKAKANAAQAIGELIQIASNKAFTEDYSKKHKNKAKHGRYRYDSRFALPVYTEKGELERYNIFSVRLLIRHDKDGCMYLYDILRTKKETGKPLGQ